MINTQKTFSWNSSFVYCFCIYAFYCLTSLLRGMSAIGVQMPIVLFCFILLLSSKGYLRSNYIQLPTLSVFFIIFNYIFIFGQGGTGEEGNIIKNFGANFTLFNVTFPILMVASGCFSTVDTSKLYKLVLLITLTTCITTILGTYTYDYPCRELATPNNPDLDNLYKSKNIGGYGFIYYLLLLIPILIGKIRKNRGKLEITVLLASIGCVIRSEYTTALLIMFVTFGGSLYIISKNIFIKLGAVIVGVVVIFFLEDILIWAGSAFGESSFFVEQRINMLLDYNSTGQTDGDMAERQELYMLSLNSFLNNPLFGGMFSPKTHVGGHSEVLDYLGHSGLVGLLLLSIMYKTLKYRTPMGEINYKNPFIKLSSLIALVIASMNTFLSPELIFGVTVLPLLASNNNSFNI